MYTVELYDRTYSPVLTEGLILKPTFYSARAWGGPDVAEIAVEGQANALWAAVNWLRYWVVIRNPVGNRVWWGYVNGVSVGMGAVEAGRTLEGMANRLIADYSVDNATGGQERGTTAWAQDAGSVAMYGTKEERLSVADATAAQAGAARDTALAKRKKPLVTMSMNESSGARLDCVGLWKTLEWQLYSNSLGRHEHAVDSDIEHMLGWSVPAHTTKMGFFEERLGDLDCRLGQLIPGTQVRVAGAFYAGNNGLHVVESPGDPGDAPVTYSADTIGFEGSDDIYDVAGGLGAFKVGYMITTSGSAQTENNDTFWISKISNPDDAFEVEQHSIVSENDATAPTITIKQGHHASFADTAFTREVVSPAQTITLTAVGSLLSQEFEFPTATGWTVREVRIRARKVGSPADNLRVRLMPYDRSSTLATGTLAGSAVGTEMEWLSFDLGAGAALAGLTTYQLVVDRTGAADWDDFFVVGLESGLTYAGKQLTVYDSGAATWGTRAPDDADLPFILRGLVDTTTQIGEMLDAAQFVGTVDVVAASGIETLQWREGDQTIRSEVERLLETGTSSGGSLAVRVLPDRTVTVVTATASSSENLLLAPDGQLREPIRGPAEEGLLPVGLWVTIEGAPSVLEDVATFYVERAEFDVTGGRLRLEPRANE